MRRGLPCSSASRSRFRTMSSSSRPKPINRASRIRCRSTIRCACARFPNAITRSKARRPIASSWACAALLDGANPDLVLSGVNCGQNVAEDVIYSGTVAGAHRRARSSAFRRSRCRRPMARRPAGRRLWNCAEAHAPALIGRILAEGIPPNVVININFPACAPDEVQGVAVTVQGRRGYSVKSTRARTDAAIPIIGSRSTEDHLAPGAGHRSRRPCAQNRISVTPLRLDLTDEACSPAMRGRCAKLKPWSRDGPRRQVAAHTERAHAGLGASQAAFLLTMRARGIQDLNVLRALETVPREIFVPHRYADLARRQSGAAAALRPDLAGALARRPDDRGACAGPRIIACSKSAPGPATRRRCSRGLRAKSLDRALSKPRDRGRRAAGAACDRQCERHLGRWPCDLAGRWPVRSDHRARRARRGARELIAALAQAA